ncbi:MAG: prepilin-type cleavage/methylation domain-containing protein, partial [Gammaproteobacteria bacterium]|nr:prepilin-type cleavage/methylation domain-containing protein [Gammaproteobacteria bacterium]
EVAEGIENMQLLFGVDTSGDNNANKYVRADEVLDTGVTWNDVVSVRLGLLAQTPSGIAINNDTDTYKLAGTDVSPDAADRKQRYQYNTTIKIRNRGEM